MGKIDLNSLPVKTGSAYPGKLNAEMDGRSQLRVGAAGGLTQFGANIVMLEPGAKSSLRHWHENQDEFVMITQGICVLIEDQGETEMTVGECATFKAGDPNGHQFVNKSTEPSAFLVIGTHTPTEIGHYADIDMIAVINNGTFAFTHKDGTPYGGDKK